MSDKLKELAEMRGLIGPNYYISSHELEKFAGLIIQECLNHCDWQTGQRIQKYFQYRDNRWPETEQNPRPF